MSVAEGSGLSRLNAASADTLNPRSWKYSLDRFMLRAGVYGGKEIKCKLYKCGNVHTFIERQQMVGGT